MDRIKRLALENALKYGKADVDKVLGKVLAESINRIYEGEPMGVIFDGLYKKIEDHQ